MCSVAALVSWWEGEMRLALIAVQSGERVLIPMIEILPCSATVEIHELPGLVFCS